MRILLSQVVCNFIKQMSYLFIQSRIVSKGVIPEASSKKDARTDRPDQVNLYRTETQTYRNNPALLRAWFSLNYSHSIRGSSTQPILEWLYFAVNTPAMHCCNICHTHTTRVIHTVRLYYERKGNKKKTSQK